MSKSEPIEVRDMAIVHRTFRNAYAEAAQLVRARPTPSAERVTFLADHIDFGIAMLHHHHEAEDDLCTRYSSSACPSKPGPLKR